MAKPPPPRVTLGDALKARGVALHVPNTQDNNDNPPLRVEVAPEHFMENQTTPTHTHAQTPTQQDSAGKTARLERVEAQVASLLASVNTLASNVGRLAQAAHHNEEGLNTLNDAQEEIGRAQASLQSGLGEIKELLRNQQQKPAVVVEEAPSRELAEMRKMLEMFMLMSMSKGGGGRMDPSMMMMAGFGGGGEQASPHVQAMSKVGAVAAMGLQAKMVAAMSKQMGLDKQTSGMLQAAVLGTTYQPVESGLEKALPVLGNVIGQAASGLMSGLARSFGDAKWGGNK